MKWNASSSCSAPRSDESFHSFPAPARAAVAHEESILRLILLLLGIALTQPALSAELKIGFVSIEKILRESGPAKRADDKLQKEFTARKAQVEKLRKQGRDLQAFLEKEGVTLSDSERRNRERDLAILARDMERMEREYNEDLNLRKNDEYAAVLQRANNVVKQIAENEKFDLIVQEAVYVSKQIDITDKVLKALTEK